MPMTGEAYTYYIKPSGNDDSSGLSIAGAWKNFRHVDPDSGFFTGGDTLLILPGNYHKVCLEMAAGGTESDRTAYISVDGSGSYSRGTAHLYGGDSVTASWTVYSGNIYQCSYAPSSKKSGWPWNGVPAEYVGGITQDDSMLVARDALDSLNAPGKMFYNSTTDVLYAYAYDLGSGYDPDNYEMWTCLDPVFWNMENGHDYITVRGLDMRNSEAYVFFLGEAGHVEHLLLHECWLRYQVNPDNHSNGAILGALNSSDTAGTGKFNIIRACSLDFAWDADKDVSYTNRFETNTYCEEYIWYDSNYFGPHANHGIYYKGVFLGSPPMASVADTIQGQFGWCCSYNHIDIPEGYAIISISNPRNVWIYGNLFKCSGQTGQKGIGLLVSGAGGAGAIGPFYVYNNSFYDCDEAMTLGDPGRATLDGIWPEQGLFKFNAIEYNHATPWPIITWANNCPAFVSDSNMHGRSDGRYYCFEGGGGTTYTFAQWQTNTGNDLNSVTTSPSFIDPTNFDFERSSYTEWDDSLYYWGRWWYTEGAWQPRGGSEPPEPPAEETTHVPFHY